MLLQSLSLVATTASVILCLRPPASSKTVSKNDKVRDEGGIFSAVLIHALPHFGEVGSVLATASYLTCVHLGYIPDELTTWQVAATVLAVLGYALRAWAFRTLNNFFTYQLTIRKDHKLVQTGPYTYLLHPSYTGMLMAFPGYMFWIGHGFWPLIKPHLWLPISGLMVCVTHTILCYKMIAYRIRGEEEMLEQHFGQAWRQHAAQRWRLIPFVF